MSIIKIENLYKKYLINHEQSLTSDSLKAALTNGFKRCLSKITRQNITPPSSKCEEFWALKNISLSIEEGDRVAFLGRNGAGKSTLLKILSRITEPTKGKVTIRGRITSLLEVGTGFHPDLTGRENILLNASIMGMSYREIRRKFDEIVAFADIEKFLDTPVKRYSSGMFMRLGFAIAAHLDSEIMIVDEVLAVGDTQFQEKCLKKMNEKSVEGKTILFVSHNIESILSLCNKGGVLINGEMGTLESIEQCVSRYVRSCPVAGLDWRGNSGDDHVRFYQVSLTSPSTDMGFFYHGEKTSLTIDFEILKPHADLIIGFSILNSRQHLIARSRLCDHSEHYHVVNSKGHYQITFELDLNLFHPGEYQIRMECSLLNKKKILSDDILLKFAVYSQNKNIKYELGVEKDGISLGNRWMLSDAKESSDVPAHSSSDCVLA